MPTPSLRPARHAADAVAANSVVAGQLRLQVLLLRESGPLLRPVHVPECADPGGPLIEETVIGRLHPDRAEHGRTGQRAEIRIAAFEWTTQFRIFDNVVAPLP